MQFLKLVEAITTNLTADNISNMVSLVEKLITLGESIKKQVSDADSSNNAG